MKKLIKYYAFPDGDPPRTIMFGALRGLRMHIDLSWQAQLWLGLAERETHKFLQRAARTVSWLVDVGAGAGELSLHFAHQPNVARVYAIEPVSLALKRNVALSPPSAAVKLEIISKCAGKNDDVGTLTLDALPLDRAAHGLVKIDVDGGEVDVLAGATKLLASGIADVLVETHSPQLEASCMADLRALGYRPQIIDQAWWRLFIPEQRPIPHNRWIWAPQHARHNMRN